MNKHAIITGLCLCILPATQAQAKSNDNAGTLTITVTKLEITDKTLELRYETRNDSEDDIWILTGWEGTKGGYCEVFMAEDDQTLVIRNRLGLPLRFGFNPPPFYGKYTRLRRGESRTSMFFAAIPVRPRWDLERAERKERGLEHATRLAIEVGYYAGNLPDSIFKMLKSPVNVLPKDTPESCTYRDVFSGWNERLLSRDEEVLIPHRPWEFKGERVLRTVVDNLHIPYRERKPEWVEPEVPDLTSCNRVEFQYQASMLEFFFPYVRRQNLLSNKDEVDYLQSARNYTLETTKEIGAFAADVRKAGPATIISVASGSYVDLVCDCDDKPQMPFRIFSDGDIKIEKTLLACEFPSLRALMPLIQTIDLRMRCAANLKNQWYRLRFYNLHEALRQNDPSIRNRILYPRPTDWCDEMLRPYPALGGFAQGKWDAKPHVCPSASEGKNHYAMNPNCKPDSPADTVLLFETKGGWNQHGGPELFTFDNHDPKGGCVLLNDGTVKFIRTSDDLRQLRWE